MVGNEMRAAAAEVLRAARAYQPEHMTEFVGFLKQLPAPMDDIAETLKIITQRAHSQFPLHPTVIAALGELYRIQRTTVGVAANLEPLFRSVMARELTMTDNPRAGEHLWNVGTSTQGIPTSSAGIDAGNDPVPATSPQGVAVVDDAPTNEPWRAPLPKPITSTTVKYGGRPLTIAAHGGGEISITDDHGNVAALTTNELRDLVGRALGSYDMNDGDQRTVVRRYPYGDTVGGWGVLMVGIQKVRGATDREAARADEPYLADRFALHLAPHPDPWDYELFGTPPAAEMTAGQIAQLGNKLEDWGAGATRADTGHGMVNMYTVGHGGVIQPERGSALHLNRKSWQAIDRAMNDLLEDEGRESPAPGDENEIIVPTNVGNVAVRLVGTWDDGTLSIEPDALDTAIQIDLAHYDSGFFDWFDGFDY